MASTKPAATTRRARTGSRTDKGADPEISHARWAGVALVITALVGAITLAVISPSETGSDSIAGVGAVAPTPTPAASASTDTRLPTAIPAIKTPGDGTDTSEWDALVTVTVPNDKLPAKKLALVVLRGEEEIGRKERPKLGGEDVIAGVRLDPGPNEITVVLESAGGQGPRSEPVTVILDRDKPELAVTFPEGRHKTFDDTILVEGVTEPGAEVRVINAALKKSKGSTRVVGISGTFEFSVPLKKGPNQITAESTDSAGQTQDVKVVVVRQDGRPSIKLDAPKKISRGELPKEVKLGVTVTDSESERMADAAVTFHLQGTGRPAETFETETNANGRATWKAQIKGGNSNPIELVVEVTSEQGQTRNAKQQIEID